LHGGQQQTVPASIKETMREKKAFALASSGTSIKSSVTKVYISQDFGGSIQAGCTMNGLHRIATELIFQTQFRNASREAELHDQWGERGSKKSPSFLNSLKKQKSNAFRQSWLVKNLYCV
jgi:hypothetical protein